LFEFGLYEFSFKRRDFCHNNHFVNFYYQRLKRLIFRSTYFSISSPKSLFLEVWLVRVFYFKLFNRINMGELIKIYNLEMCPVINIYNTMLI